MFYIPFGLDVPPLYKWPPWMAVICIMMMPWEFLPIPERLSEFVGMIADISEDKRVLQNTVMVKVATAVFWVLWYPVSLCLLPVTVIPGMFILWLLS